MLLMYLLQVLRYRLHLQVVGYSLVEEWFKDDDLITRLDKAHEGTQHA